MEKQTIRTLGISLAVMGIVTFVVQIIATAVMQLAAPDLLTNPWANFALTGLFWVFGVPAFFLLARKVPHESGPKQNLSLLSFLGYFATAMGLTYVLSMVGNGITSLFNKWLTGESEIYNPVADLIDGANIWIVVLFVCVGAPIFEELVFRKLLMDRLRPFGDRFAILCSGIAFGLYHGNFSQLFYAAAIGILLGYVMVRTNRLVYPILLHVVINLTGSALPLVLERYATEQVSNVIYYVLMGGSILLALLLILLNYRRVQLDGPRYTFSVPVNAKLALANGGTIFYLLVCGGLILLSIWSATMAVAAG